MKRWLWLVLIMILVGCSSSTNERKTISLRNPKNMVTNFTKIEHPGFAYLFKDNYDLVYADELSYIYKQTSTTSSSLYYVDLKNNIPILIANGIAIDESPIPIYQAFQMTDEAFYFTTYQASIKANQGKSGAADPSTSGYQIMKWDIHTGILEKVEQDAIFISLTGEHLYFATVDNDSYHMYKQKNLVTNETIEIHKFDKSPRSLTGENGMALIAYTDQTGIVIDVYTHTDLTHRYRIKEQDILVDLFEGHIIIENYLLGKLFAYDMTNNTLIGSTTLNIDTDAMYITSHLIPGQLLAVDYQTKEVHLLRK